MNIAFVLPYWAERFGGPVTMAKNIGGTLSAMGHNVSYWATSDEETGLKVDDSHTNVRVFKTHWPRSWFRSPELAKTLNDEITSFDLIEVNGIWEYTVFKTARIARRADIPYVIRPTGVFTHPWRYRTLKKQLSEAGTYAPSRFPKTSCLPETWPTNSPNSIWR